MDFTYKQPLEKILKDLKETQQVEKIKSASKSLSDWFVTVYIEELINNEKMMTEFVRQNPEIQYGMQIKQVLQKAYHYLRLYERNHDEQSLQKGLSIMVPLLRVFMQRSMYDKVTPEKTQKKRG